MASFFSHRFGKRASCLTKRALDWWVAPALTRLEWAIQSSWTNGVRLRLTRPICRIFEHFSGFEFSLLPNRVHARPSASNANRWAARAVNDKK